MSTRDPFSFTGVASCVGSYAFAKKLGRLSNMLSVVICYLGFFSGELSMLFINSRSSMGLTFTPKDLAAMASLMSHFGNFLLDDAIAILVFLPGYLVEPSHLGLKLSLLKDAVWSDSSLRPGDFFALRRAERGGDVLSAINRGV